MVYFIRQSSHKILDRPLEKKGSFFGVFFVGGWGGFSLMEGLMQNEISTHKEKQNKRKIITVNEAAYIWMSHETLDLG